MSIIYNIGSTWRGFPYIRRLVIFGDSYSSIENAGNHNEIAPNPADPLGVPFPGTGVWNEENEPNWVGHLLTKYRPGPRYIPPKAPHDPGKWEDQSTAWLEHPLLVNDYAKGGDTVAGVARQVSYSYLPGLGKKHNLAPWTSEDCLFVTWVGINDCAYGYRDEIMERLFSLQDEVYNTGARNFLFVDIPPISRSPAVAKSREESAAKIYNQWNSKLHEAAKSFCSTHEDSSVFVFSSANLFNTLLDDPATFGFQDTDVKRRGGTFWIDHIHPTSKVHDYMAKYLAEFLSNIPAEVE